MITVDTSAIIAILKGEPEAGSFLRTLSSAERVQLSAATYVECGLVVDARGDAILSERFDQLLAELKARIVDVSAEHARLARDAYRQFGKGSGHPAKLNFGDCFSYALAAESRTPLLFKGDDFTHTDVVPANPALTQMPSE